VAGNAVISDLLMRPYPRMVKIVSRSENAVQNGVTEGFQMRNSADGAAK